MRKTWAAGLALSLAFAGFASAQDISVGVAGPMTGPEASFGTQLKNGAEAALAETEDADVNSNTAYLYEIKARASLQRELPDRERHLAHAIALHLAVGEDDIARELADYFRPSFSHDEQGGVDASLDQKGAMPQQSL